LKVCFFLKKIGFAAESMSFLKFIEAQVPKEKLGLLAIPLTPLQIILPLYLSKYTNGSRPFDLFVKAIPFRYIIHFYFIRGPIGLFYIDIFTLKRLFMGIVVACWVYATPWFKDSNNEYPFYYFLLCLLINSVHSVFTYSMFVSQMAFFAKISDKAIGGTYMTFLNTISNMGK
jgi:PAT family acetyl-CoA transporter-like MFS transporter 1